MTLAYTPVDTDFSAVRFQNNIQSCFSRVRLLYGSTPLEDIPNYNCIVRALTEWTSSDPLGADQTSVTDGIGGVAPTLTGSLTAGTGTTALARTTNVGALVPVVGNVRQKMIHGVDLRGVTGEATGLTGFGVVPNGTAISALTNHATVASKDPTRRYQVQLALGLLTQEKLIPTKFMASQLAIEITLANPADCIYQAIAGSSVPSPTYTVTNVNLIPEILEFDASYDESFLRGLQGGGVPIKFSTWNNYRFTASNSSTFNLQIQERSRSVKAIFAMQRREQPIINADSGATFFNSDITTSEAASTLQDFQFRIGGRYFFLLTRYFPASPVQNALSTAATTPNGGAESYTELAKAINILGNSSLSTSVSAIRWAMNPAKNNFVAGAHPILQEFDYDCGLIGYKAGGGIVMAIPSQASNGTTAAAGDLGSACFAMATDLETSNGLEISGLNAEEQSDISLLVRYSASQGIGTNGTTFAGTAISSNGMLFDVFTYIDSMIVLRENNVLELIQ